MKRLALLLALPAAACVALATAPAHQPAASQPTPAQPVVVTSGHGQRPEIQINISVNGTPIGMTAAVPPVGFAHPSGVAHQSALVMPVEAAQGPVELSVMRHEFLPSFSNSDLLAAFDEMSKVLQIKDGADDVACDITFRQKGNVGVFRGPDPISSDADFSQVANLGSRHHI